MTPEKRAKIKALLNNTASTPNEKEICRKLLAMNPELKPDPPVNPFGIWGIEETLTQSRAAGQQFQAAARRQRAARQQEDAARGIHWGQSQSDASQGAGSASRQDRWNQYKRNFSQGATRTQQAAAGNQATADLMRDLQNIVDQWKEGQK